VKFLVPHEEALKLLGKPWVLSTQALRSRDLHLQEMKVVAKETEAKFQVSEV
jgi:hypothetical protein